jgi:DNA-binding transcriptional MerR regulator
MVEERSHLAIGEVLSLLHDEFPDVTISKIRFLESQGLVDPERTPSGYRKFYDGDVERLRWILLQQKEHFLPLKVIKDRLAELDAAGLPLDDASVSSGGDASPLPGSPGSLEEAGASPAPSPAETRAAVSLSVVPSLSSLPSAQAERGGGVDGGRGARNLMAVPDVPEANVPVPEVAEANVPVPEVAEAGAGGPADVADELGASTAGSGADTPDVESAAAQEEDGPGEEQAAGDPHGDPDGEEAVEIAVEDTSPATRAEVVAASGDPDTMTIEELAAATGLDLAAITELQQFGLVTPSGTVGGTTYFDQIALEVARTAAGFAGHGVEARHLRAWRNSAEREVSIFEQVVMPLLRQRNPQARGQAEATLAELAGLGADLRVALVRQALRSVR